MCLKQFRCQRSEFRDKCRDPGWIDFRQGDVALDCHVELRIKSRWGCILLVYMNQVCWDLIQHVQTGQVLTLLWSARAFLKHIHVLIEGNRVIDVGVGLRQVASGSLHF